MKILILLTTMAMLLTSCLDSEPVELTPAEFEEHYLRPRHEMAHIDYSGHHDGQHYLTFYGVGKNGSVVKPQQLYRTPDAAAIQMLIKRPQPPIIPTSKVPWSERVPKSRE